MAPSLSLRGLTVVICSLAVLSLAQTLDTLYVKPTPGTPCDEVPCFTLMEYVNNSSQYFTRDTEAVFLSGRHLLGRTVLVRDITTFIIRREISAYQSHPEIVCTAAVGLLFLNMSFVSINELSFTSCGDVTSTAPVTWVLYALFVDLFVMANTTVSLAHATAVTTSYSNFLSLGNLFRDNVGQGITGGSIDAFSSNVMIEDNQFYNNSASSLSAGSGAVNLLDSMAVFSGVNIFSGNKALSVGGAVSTHLSEVIFSGVNIFSNNKAGFGGGISIFDSVVFFEGSTTFMQNYASQNGGGITSLGSIIDFTGDITFIYNSANLSSDGAAAAFSSFFDFVNFTGNTTFLKNGPSPTTLVFLNCTAVIRGIFTFEYNQGGLSALDSSSVSFTGNTTFSMNGPSSTIVYVISGTIQFMGCTTFIGNTDTTAGAAVNAIDSNIQFIGTQHFENNFASQGGAIFMLGSVVNITGCSTFINNSASVQGGAISNANGELYITGNATFVGNQARFGGGLNFYYITRFFLISPLQLSFQHNSAEQGGAIYVNDLTNNFLCFNDSILNIPTSVASCFIHAEFLANNTLLDFSGNTASVGGESIFGGMLDRCIVNVNDNIISPERGLSLLTKNFMIDNSTISSFPLRLCFCMNGKENCDHEPPPFSTVRGATISVSAVAVDQVNHTVAATIRSYFPYNNGTVSEFSLGQTVQQIGATCTNLNYTILTTASDVMFILYSEGPCLDIGNSQRQISVHLLPCPIAFELSNAQCVCEVRLQPFTNSCSAESQTFSRNTNFWVGTEYRDNNYTGLILHPHCPLDYCISKPTDININDLNSQCSFNRSGILCGSCQQNLSLALGSSQCLRCSNSYLALLIPFAVAGVALVFILFLLRLTLSTGTLSGLIFYANIVALKKEIFSPPRTANVLTVFIAWLNLDLGIETCFFNGMDTYTRTWLQYVFPFYIWLMVSVIIVTSHYSVRVPKLFGRNPIAVLATLFLLSYAKLLRTIIASFSATVLDYPDNTTDTVWLYDGNIRYLRGKHIPLFLFSLVVFLFLFLPYTVLLFLSQWLQALSNKKPFHWMNSVRIKTFLDTYHAPYNIKHRYWPGLLLLLRCVLFLVFASNASGDPSINLLAIASVALGLAVLTRVTGQVYSKWWLDVLEGSFILNLGILAAATHHVIQSGGNQSAVAYISLSVAFTEFTGIVVFHTYLQLKDTHTWKSVKELIQTCIKSRQTEETPTLPEEEDIPNTPSTSYIDLREIVIDFPS